MTKSELRQIYLVRQRALSPVERAEKSHRIALHFFESIEVSRIRLLHSFIPIKKFNEVDTSPIICSIRTNLPDITIAIPRVNFETGEMDCAIYRADTELVENAWGIREPAVGNCIEPETIDMILVPGVAFDRTGHRVGYGKGFYDRFLKLCREDCAMIGLSYFEPVDEISDIHAGDNALDACITPGGVFTAGTKRRGDFLG
ncbi:MAG: 5-formyltetrahydrofolate cyclo-ligase [Pyrinomonadaceae bacterium]